ncbi:hypothetical protein AAVH_11827 [Aphelenchoides avenae]|nr:hypothetical protein AAVH_11827 [Aphelenchus avenae]
MGGSQSTIPEYERFQDTDEDESDGIQQHFAQPVRRLSQAENLRSPSKFNPPRQAQLHDSHRTRAPSQRDPYPIPVHPTHSVGPTAPAHSVGPTGNTAAHATHSVAAVRPVASRTPAPCAISYTQSSKTVILPTEHRASNLVHHPPSTTASSPAQELGTSIARFDSTASFGNRTQPIRDRDLVPTATCAVQLGATQKTSQGATATTAAALCAIPSAAAGGKGPPDSIPDGSTNSRKTDRRSESAFYRNATYTCGTDDAVQPFVLKEVPLTPFDGDVREYPRFRDRFLDIIEARPDLAPRYKLVHLLQYLRGEPLRMANRLRLTDDNYFIVVDRLEKRYGNKVSYHNVLVRDLAQLKPLTSTMLSDVTRFYDDAFQLITDLQPFIKTDSPIEHALLMGLIPVKLRLYLANETSYAGDRTANGLLKALDQLVCQGRQSILTGLDLSGEPDTDIDLVPRPVLWDDDASSEHTTREDSPEASIQGSQPSSSEPAEDQAAVAVNASTERHAKERRTCPLCGGLHTAFRCDVHTNVNARMRRIMKLKLCLLCLREGHQVATCPRKTTDSCKICRAGPHNRAICMAANRTQAKERRRSPARTTGSSVDSKKPDPERHTQQKSVNWGDGKSTSTATNLRSSEAQSSPRGTPKMNPEEEVEEVWSNSFRTRWHASPADIFYR